MAKEMEWWSSWNLQAVMMAWESPPILLVINKAGITLRNHSISFRWRVCVLFLGDWVAPWWVIFTDVSIATRMNNGTYDSENVQRYMYIYGHITHHILHTYVYILVLICKLKNLRCTCDVPVADVAGLNIFFTTTARQQEPNLLTCQCQFWLLRPGTHLVSLPGRK